MSTQFVVDDQGNRVAVLLDIETYEHLLEDAELAEDLAYAQEYTARKTAGQLNDDERSTVPLDQVIAEFEARHADASQQAA
jgi:hypothetical protein